MQSQKRLLIAIIVLGIIIVGASFWFRNYEKDKKGQDIKEQIEKLDQIQTTEALKEDDAVLLIFSEDKSTTTESSGALKETGAMEDKEEAIGKTEPEEEPEKVIIKDTETGWLNVREGPSTAYNIITQVLPGEKFELIDEDNNWTNIKISEEIEGWAYSKYIEKYTEESVE